MQPLFPAAALTAATLLVAASQPAHAQEPRPPSAEGPAPGGTPTQEPTPFTGFETSFLDNGLRVWFKRLPGARDVTTAVLVPFGWDQDPEGKEELAHFTEHMLFSDHAGRTEEEILEAVELRGGRRNGLTTPDRTFYYVTLPREHGTFGIEWLGRVLEPKAMDPAVVARNRQPVALEIRARPREFFDHLRAWLNPEWLRPADYWEREFGLVTRDARRYDRWASLHRISPRDLRDFYRRYYAPEGLTVVVVGDLPADSVHAAVDAAFGGLEPRPVPEAYGPVSDPGRPFKRVQWTVRPNVQYQRIAKIYGMDTREHLTLLFIDRYLERRLRDRLRFGEVKAVYSLALSVTQRGPAAHVLLSAPVDPQAWAYAETVVQEEVDRLVSGSVSAEEFAADRAAVVGQLVSANREPEDLAFWAHNHFYRRDLHPDFPDLAASFAAMTPQEVAEVARTYFRPEREAVWITRPQPLNQGILALAAVVLLFSAVRLTARLLTRPVDLRTLRYVARIRLGPLGLAFWGLLYVGVGVVAGRLLVALVQAGLQAWVLPVDVYAYQMTTFALLGVAAMALGLAYLSLPPRKLLLFRDEVRVKHLAYRSRSFPLERVQVAPARLGDVARAGALFRTLPLAAGYLRPAVWIRPESGMGYLLRVRDADELVAMVERARAATEGPDDTP